MDTFSCGYLIEQRGIEIRRGGEVELLFCRRLVDSRGNKEAGGCNRDNESVR